MTKMLIDTGSEVIRPPPLLDLAISAPDAASLSPTQVFEHGHPSPAPAAFPTAIVGRDALFREGLGRILNAGPFRVVASALRVQDLDFRSDEQQLLILNVGDDSEEAVRQIKLAKARCRACRAAVIAHRHEHAQMMSLFQAGASAYFVNVTSCEAFIKSLELVMLGETIIPSGSFPFTPDCQGRRPREQCKLEDLKRMDPRSGPEHQAPRLSERQDTILSYLIEGASNKVIARRLNISEATVKVHVKMILRKIGVCNRTQAAIWAIGAPRETDDRTGRALFTVARRSAAGNSVR